MCGVRRDRMPSGADLVPPQIVDQNEDDVGLLRGGGH